MNLVLTRTKNEHLSFLWEPFATSTPLKAISNNVTTRNESQKPVNSNSNDFLVSLQKKYNISPCFQKDKSIESKHSVLKRKRKKKSLAYFDLSSSDEDNSFECKKRPIIKLHSGKKTKSALITKKQTDGKIGLKRKGSKIKEVNCESVGNINTEESEKNAVSTKSAKSKRIYHQNLTDIVALNPDSDFKINSVSSDDESKIFDETNKAKDSMKSMLPSKHKERTVNNLENNDSMKELSAFNEIEMTMLTGTLTTNQVSTKSFHKNIIKDFQNLKDTQKGAPKTNDLLNKIRGKNFEKRIGFVTKNRAKNVRSKLAEQSFNMVLECAKNSQHNHENKANLTHQLFSDTKEQEFMNTLDLTADEFDEAEENMRCSVCRKENNVSNKPIFISHSSNLISLSHNETKQVKLKRRKPNSKKLFTLENPLKEFVPNDHEKKQNKKEKSVKTNDNNKTQECQLPTNSNKLELFMEKVNKENVKKNNTKNQKAQKKGNRKTVNVVGENKTTSATNDAVNLNINEKIKAEKNVTLSSKEFITEFNKNSELNKPLETTEDGNEVNKKKPVFKLLNELSYEENKMGCSVVQCWNIGTFKCGVFKLKVKSLVTCKTLHSNSHLGGVLVKGNLRMKIANRELDLKEGDTAFVPPLTEWQATNIGDCESIFYYWCGRFSI